MKRIDHETATIEGLFTDGNPALEIEPTVVTSDWLNHIQEEIARFIEGMGATLDPENFSQLLQAFRSAVGTGGDPAITGTGGPLNGPGLKGVGGGNDGSGVRGDGSGGGAGVWGFGGSSDGPGVFGQGHPNGGPGVRGDAVSGVGGVFQSTNCGAVQIVPRAAVPTGPAEQGELCVVNGKLIICTVGGEPGTWAVVGTQT
jgi:hypothetical protein